MCTNAQELEELMTSVPMKVRDEDLLGSARTVSAGGGIRSVGKTRAIYRPLFMWALW